MALQRSQSVRLLEGDHSALAQEVIKLRAQNKDQLDAIKSMYTTLDQMRINTGARNASLERQLNDLRSLVMSQLQLTK